MSGRRFWDVEKATLRITCSDAFCDEFIQTSIPFMNYTSY